MFKYYIYQIGIWLANILPLKAAYNLGIFLSDLHYFFAIRDRKIVTNNLQCILGRKDNLKSLVREVFRNFGRYLVEFFRTEKFIDRQFVRKNIKIENQYILDDMRKQGRGAILITAHLGNWELGSFIVSLLGYPTVVIALPHKERSVNEFFNRQRKAKGLIVIPTNIALRKCIEALRDNKFVAMAADRDFSLSGEVIDFLGKKTLIPRGAAAFSRKLNVPIVPAFLIRDKKNKLHLAFEAPLSPDMSLDEEESVLQLMRAYTSVIEKKIRQHPAQWLMFRKFWIS